jgi:hypothetical protein
MELNDGGLWLIGLAGNMPFIAISFAIVGQGNRLHWVLLGPTSYAALSAAFFLGYALLPTEPTLLRNLYLYAGVTVVPALGLYCASVFRRHRARQVMNTAKT